MAQRKLSRRFKKGTKEQSKNYQKQKGVVAKLHEHIRNQREDYLHKASTWVIRSFDTVCLEELNIKGMMQNEKLALAIGEVGWHKFKTMLEYKAEWYGGNLLYIGRFAPIIKTVFPLRKSFQRTKFERQVLDLRVMRHSPRKRCKCRTKHKTFRA